MTQKTTEYTERLEQIAHLVFGNLTDDQVLQLLAERKQLEGLKQQYELVQQEQARAAQAQAEMDTVKQELDRLNALISPDKPDDELIHLVEERKTWEAKLSAAEATFGTLKKGDVTVKTAPEAAPSTGTIEEESVTPDSEPVALESARVESPEVTPSVGKEGIQGASVDKDFGEQKILETTLDVNSELGQYLEQIRNNPEMMGKILDELPASAKRDKTFMLALAEIDPAYAMHYADAEVLKKDEDFNVRVAAIKGKRASGSVLAEMLPDARTEAVVMASLKQDYRNIRYALPQMPSYDKMLEKAKKAALEKVKDLKESVDISLLVPKILQKDKEFMAKVEKIIPKED